MQQKPNNIVQYVIKLVQQAEHDIERAARLEQLRQVCINKHEYKLALRQIIK